MSAAAPRAHRWRWRLRREWRRRRWLLTGAAAVAALALGFVGYGSERPVLSVPDRFYDTVQLFAANGSLRGPLPVALEVARWLAPLTVAYAGFRTLQRIFSEQWTQLRVHLLLRNHVVVCGLGRVGSRLAFGFHDRGSRVVVLDRNPTSAEAEECRDRGMPVLRGDATDRFVLSQTSLHRARYLIATCGDDSRNAEVGLQAAQLAGRRRRPLRGFLHIADNRLCTLLETSALAATGSPAVRYEFFNVFQAGPRLLLEEHGRWLTGDGAASPHLLVAGAGELGLNVVTELARAWQLADHGGPGRLRITLLATDAQVRAEQLQLRVPALASAGEICPRNLNPAELTGPARDAFRSEVAARPPRCAFVCLDDDAAGMRAAIQLRSLLPHDRPIVVCTTGRSGVTELLNTSAATAVPNLHGFSMLDQVCRPEMLLGGITEQLAQAVHADYVRRKSAAGAGPGQDPALRPWAELPETLRESNREQAADIGGKLAAVGYALVPTTDWTTPPVSFTDAEVEQLARIEHDRWCAERTRQGWRPGPVRDPERRITPYLVGWDELTEPVRDLDRDAVRALPAFLARAGFALGRRASSPEGVPVQLTVTVTAPAAGADDAG